MAWDWWGVNGENQQNGFYKMIGSGRIVPNGEMGVGMWNLNPDYSESPSIHLVDYALELSECPCDPRRRHERLGQKVAVV